MSDIFLSIVVPAFNERTSIARTLGRIGDWLDAKHYPAEVIVSADGADGTREAAARCTAGDPRFIVRGHPFRAGKGRGVRDGILSSRGEFVGFIDADYKTPIVELEKLLPVLQAGHEVVIGSRRASSAQVEVPQPMYRRIGSQAFGYAVRGMMGLEGIRDTQCGFKFFQRRAAHTLFSMQQIDGYMFDVEILRLARQLNYRIVEVGVRWQDDGDTRYNPLWGTWKNARELMRIRRLRYPNPQTQIFNPRAA